MRMRSPLWVTKKLNAHQRKSFLKGWGSCGRPLRDAVCRKKPLVPKEDSICPVGKGATSVSKKMWNLSVPLEIQQKRVLSSREEVVGLEGATVILLLGKNVLTRELSQKKKCFATEGIKRSRGQGKRKEGALRHQGATAEKGGPLSKKKWGLEESQKGKGEEAGP